VLVTPKTRGFTLIELLVAMTISSIVMGVFVKLMLSTTRYRREVEARLETHQGLKAAIDALTRDLRLAGSCMPAGNDFLAISGVDSQTTDQIGVHIGELFEGGCVNSTVTATVAAGTTQIFVANAVGFRAGQRVYLIHPDTFGEFQTVRSVDAGNNSLVISPGVARDYPVPTGVWAMQQRDYSIMSILGPPRLMLGIDGARPQPMALGISRLDVRYRLRENCPPCTEVALPADAAEWRLVTDVLIDLTARSASPVAPGTFYTITEQIRVKPRNLLP